MARYRAEMSERMSSFLLARMQANMEDHSVAYKWVYETLIEHTDKDAHNYFDIILTDDTKPAITYTTLKRWESHRDKLYAEGRHADVYARETFRISGKPGKVAQRVTDVKDGRALDVFVGALAAYLAPPDSNLLQVAEGKDISYWYGQRNYCKCPGYNGQGPHTSCMRSDTLGRQGRFRTYEESAKMLIRLCETCGKLQGRAILWTDNDGDLWIDRIYATTRVAEQMHQWAQANGYSTIYRYGAGYSERKQKTSFEIDVSKEGIERMPYFDTMAACRNCNRLYYGNSDHHNYYQRCTPHNKTFTIAPGKWAGANDPDAPPDTCESCGRDLDEYGMCEYATQCENCETDYCGWNGNCPNECTTCNECGAWYAGGEECPNMTYCDVHGNYYCLYTSCDEAIWCNTCNWHGCDQSDANHHAYCDEHEEWYCTYRGGTCPYVVTCHDCGDDIPCEELPEREAQRPGWGRNARIMCNVHVCGTCEEDIQSLMDSMILPQAQAEMPLGDTAYTAGYPLPGEWLTDGKRYETREDAEHAARALLDAGWRGVEVRTEYNRL